MFTKGIASLLLVGVASANPSVGRTLHAEPALPQGWSKESAKGNVAFKISLKQSEEGLEAVRSHALKASTPGDALYGQYMTSAEVASLSQPTESVVGTVKTWLAEIDGCDAVDMNRELLSVECTVEGAQAALLTTLDTVHNEATKQSTLRAGDYSLPADVEQAVTTIYGLHGLPLPPKTRQSAEGDIPIMSSPANISSTYNVKGDSAMGSYDVKNRQAVAEFQSSEGISQTDLNQFFEKYVPGSPKKAAKVFKYQGSPATGALGGESSLDIQTIMGIAPKILTEFWYQQSNDFCSDLKVWAGDILSAKNPPLVHSVSYGWQGDLNQIGCTTAQVTDIDNDLTKLAAMGLSIIFASGDSGSAYDEYDSKDHPLLFPSWPASSQWVTAVGATRFVDFKVGNAEMASDQFGSGSGFSSLFPAFAAQKEATAGYLAKATGLPPQASFSAGGRGTADISALGEGFPILVDGELIIEGGTSASTPLFAGLVSLLNEQRLAAGKPQMGYLNPWIYANPQAFTDVTLGTDKIDRMGQQVDYGYDCAEGWDPATGLGTPIFDEMVKAALA